MYLNYIYTKVLSLVHSTASCWCF